MPASSCLLSRARAALGRIDAGEPVTHDELLALARDARALLQRLERLRSLDPALADSVGLHPTLEALARGVAPFQALLQAEQAPPVAVA